MTGQKQSAECESTTTPSLHYHLPSYLFVVDIIISGPTGSSTNPDKAMMDRNLDANTEVFGNPQGLTHDDFAHGGSFVANHEIIKRRLGTILSLVAWYFAPNAAVNCSLWNAPQSVAMAGFSVGGDVSYIRGKEGFQGGHQSDPRQEIWRGGRGSKDLLILCRTSLS